MNKRVRRARQNSPGWLVKQMARRMDRAMMQELESLDLDLRQFENLIFLLENDDLNQVTLARRIGEAEYATSRQIDLLEGRGLVERRRDPESRRAHRIVLTEKGRAIARQLPSVVDRVNEEVLVRLDKPEYKTFLALLKKALDMQ